jgi:hypothetical protein
MKNMSSIFDHYRICARTCKITPPQKIPSSGAEH